MRGWWEPLSSEMVGSPGPTHRSEASCRCCRRRRTQGQRRSPDTSSSAPSAGGADLAKVRVRLQRVASMDGGPLAMAVRSGDTSLYVATQYGRVLAIRDGRVDATPVLNLTGK